MRLLLPVLLCHESLAAAQHGTGSVVGEMVHQGKNDTVGEGDRQLRSARGQADKHAGGEGNEQDDDKGEHEPLHFVCIIPRRMFASDKEYQ